MGRGGRQETHAGDLIKNSVKRAAKELKEAKLYQKMYCVQWLVCADSETNIRTMQDKHSNVIDGPFMMSTMNICSVDTHVMHGK